MSLWIIAYCCSLNYCYARAISHNWFIIHKSTHLWAANINRALVLKGKGCGTTRRTRATIEQCCKWNWNPFSNSGRPNAINPVRIRITNRVELILAELSPVVCVFCAINNIIAFEYRCALYKYVIYSCRRVPIKWSQTHHSQRYRNIEWNLETSTIMNSSMLTVNESKWID